MKVKYIRVSSIGQNTDRQEDNTEKTYIDKCSGSIPFEKRTAGQELLKNLENITEVEVHSIDRLGRNVSDMLKTVNTFTDAGINLISKKEGIQTIVDGKRSPMATMLFTIMGSIAEFELSMIKERQREGIAKVKGKRKTYHLKGGRSTETKDEFLQKPKSKAISKLIKQGDLSLRKIAKLTDTSINTVRKVEGILKEY